MIKLPEEFIIFDTEFTAWEGSLEREWNGKNEYREIVQIGAIKVNNLKEVESLQIYIKPVKNPKLSEFFIKLTGVSQSIVDQEGVTLDSALTKLFAWSEDCSLYSYARDCDVIKANTELIDINFPFELDRFVDIRDYFNEIGVDASLYGSGTIPKAFGVEPPPSAHDALNDARSILLALQAASENKMLL